MENDFKVLRRSVVKLYVTSKAPNSYQPWEFGYQEGAGASGCIVSGNRILTCAHVVAHALHISAMKTGDAKRYRARVVAVDDDSELAMLAVEDPEFFDGTLPVKLGRVPHQQEEIAVWGYPRGGTELSITSGVVSRIEVVPYTHSRRSLIALETDATVAPGNSGGPVFMKGELVGIALQPVLREEARKASLIPIPVIEHFFTDLLDGDIAGVPDLGVYWQNIENDNLRDYFGVPPRETGVLVTRVVNGSSADGFLEPGDVIRAIDGVTIAGNGSCTCFDDLRLNFSVLVSRRQVGDVVPVEITRRHEPLMLQVPLRPYTALVKPTYPDQVEGYFIFAGFVFQRLTHSYLAVWKDQITDLLSYYANIALPSADRKEIVVLSQVLAHDINAGYHPVHLAVVARINGIRIGKLLDVVRAFEQPEGKFQVIELETFGSRVVDSYSITGTHVVLDAEAAREAGPEILKLHGIASDRSSDLS